MVPIRFILLFALLPLAESAYACGWWGNGEMSRNDSDVTTHDGHSLEQSLSFKSMKLPGKMGYGIAVPEPGRAIPYLLVTLGQPITRIIELKVFGFRSVIDLGTSELTAHLHRSETEAAGMQYFNIPIEGDMPNRRQTDFFNRIVVNAHNGPLLVYAPRAALLAVMWASYRIRLGSSMEFALGEGRTLGLTGEQETEMRNREQW